MLGLVHDIRLLEYHAPHDHQPVVLRFLGMAINRHRVALGILVNQGVGALAHGL